MKMATTKLPFKFPALLFIALTLNACTALGPEYQEPEVPWLQNWQPTSYPDSANARQTEFDLHFWWLQFDDPVLTALIDTVQKENLSLHIAGLRVLESRAALGLVSSSLYPQVQQISGATQAVNSRENGSSSTNQVTTQLQGGLGWELDFWGRFQRAIESADAGFFASVAKQRDLQVLLNAQVAALYFNYRVTQARISITRTNVSIQQRSFDITAERFNEGDESELDFQQARTQYLATRSLIPNLEVSLRTTRNALCALLGRPPGNIPELEGDLGDWPVSDPAPVTEFPSHHLTRRPDVRVAAWQVAAQSARIGIAEADYYPAISLLGTLGWSRSNLSNLPDISSLAIGPALRWDIFDHGAIANNIRIQHARLQQTIENFQSTVLQAAREVDDATIQVLKTAEQQLILDESVDAARRALEIANTRYREGYADFQRVLSAQRAFFAQLEKQILNRGSHFNAIVTLYKGLGGGWKAATIEDMISEETRRKMSESGIWGDLFTTPFQESQPTSTKDLQND